MTGNNRPAQDAFPWPTVLGVGLAMTALSIVLWLVISSFGETQVVPAPTQVPTLGPAPTAPPTQTPATQIGPATPDDDDALAWAVGSLPAMLNQAPDLLADGSLPLNDIARYSDISGWMAAHGIDVPASTAEADGPWSDALDALALPTSLREFGLDPRWRQIYGFDLTQVQQVLDVGQAPDVVLLLRGDFDTDALMAAWVASGYQPVEVEGETVWTLAPGDEVDLSAPESRLSLGTLNNVILLDDGTLAASSRLSRIGAVLQVSHGDANSLASNEDIAPLLDPDSGIAALDSAVLAQGTLLQAPLGTPPDVGTPVAPPVSATPLADPDGPLVPEMGEVVVVLAGVAAPRAEAQSFTLWLVLENDEVALASAAMVEQRLVMGQTSNDGVPYADLLGPIMVTVADRVVTINAPEPPAGFSWLQLVSDRDLGFAWWMPES